MTDAPTNRTTRRSWDQYARSARARTFELELGQGDVVIVRSPSTDQLTAMGEAQQAGDIPGSFTALMGEDQWKRTSAYAAEMAVINDDPGIYALSLRELLSDVMDGLGLSNQGGR